MPLTKLIEGYRSSVCEFLADGNSGALFVLAAPEAESVAAKVVASVEEEPTSDDLMLAYTGPFTRSRSSSYRAAATAVLENFVEHREALQEELVHFVLPAGLDEDYRAPGCSAEALFADFAERCSRALCCNVAKRLVFVLRAEEPSDVAAFVASTSLLGSLIALERTKFVVFAAQGSAPQALVPAAQRLAVVEPEREKVLQQELVDFVGSIARRVLVIRCTQLSADRAIRELEGLRRTHFRVALRPGPLGAMLEAAVHALVAQARQRGLEPDAPDLTGVVWLGIGHCQALGVNGHVKVVYDPNGPYVATFADGNVHNASVTARGSGEGSRVVYDPAKASRRAPGAPTDVVLAHELNHAANNATGENMSGLRDPDPKWNEDWVNHEEHNTVGAENAYREQRGGVSQRQSY